MKITSDQVAVITGAGSGIGRALAINLAKRGCHLALADIDQNGIEETVKRLPTTTEVSKHVLDVADKEQFKGFVDDVVAVHQKVDLVINNAGVAYTARLENTSDEDFEWLMGINFWGVVYGSKMFLPHLRKSPDAHIVNISSVFGLISLPYQGVYNSSKFAVRGYTEALRQEMSLDSNIHVTCVHPGGIKTNIAKNARMSETPAKASAEQFVREFDKVARTSPDRAAHVIVKAIEKNQRRLLIGVDARVIDWAQRLMPSYYDKLILLWHKSIEKSLSS